MSGRNETPVDGALMRTMGADRGVEGEAAFRAALADFRAALADVANLRMIRDSQEKAIFDLIKLTKKLTHQRDALLAACKLLCEKQSYFAEHASEPEEMPGNQYYSDMFMDVVRAARAAIALCAEPAKTKEAV